MPGRVTGPVGSSAKTHGHGVRTSAPPPRPILFLDVDGTLLPTGGVRMPATDEEWDRWQLPSNPHLATMAPAHGPRLLGMPCDLRWATAWMHHANRVVAPLLGLPDLPVADLPEPPTESRAAGALHWKTRTLVASAAGHPFAWVDDEIADADRAWVTAHHPGPALLHRVEPDTGLTDADLAELDRWLRAHAADPA